MQELEQRHDQVKHQLQTLIADHEVAVFEKGAISWKRSKDGVGLDSKAVIKAHQNCSYSLVKQARQQLVYLVTKLNNAQSCTQTTSQTN